MKESLLPSTKIKLFVITHCIPELNTAPKKRKIQPKNNQEASARNIVQLPIRISIIAASQCSKT